MQVAVIGGGVIGVCTAYFLAAAGHDVAVIERRGNVAEQASFGNAGIIAPASLAPWAAPGMPRKVLSYLFQADAPVLLHPTLERALWRWIRQWLSECELDRYRINKARMQRVAFYSSNILQQLREHYQLDYERTQGHLQLFRTEHDFKQAQPALAMLAESEIPHRIVDPEAARVIEPALSEAMPFAGGLYLPQGEAGNCPLFTKQLKYIAQSLGVEFHFNSTVTAIQHDNQHVVMQIGEQSFHVDAVVLAAGIESMPLLKSLGIDVPLYPVKGYSATIAIKNFDEAPQATLMDESYKIAMTRLGNRIRIAGIAELGSYNSSLHKAALRTLIKIGNDWFPNAANYGNAHFWCGARPMLPDSAPLLGATPVNNVFINIGHGASGWAMAAGSGKIVADIVSGTTPEIDMDGLTLSRYKQ